MIEDFSQLKIERAIFHRVYAPTKDGKKSPQISQQIIQFDDSNLKKSLFLKDQIIKALSQYAVRISIDDNSPSTTPALIRDFFLKIDNTKIDEKIKFDAFLQHSVSMAHNLDNSQDLRSTSGVLCVISGHIEKKPVLIISKLEEGEDLQIQEIKDGGIFKLDINIVENIIRMHKSNVLKVGIFYQKPKKPDGKESEIVAYLCDIQNIERKSADYYLKDFLGCLYTHDPKFQTQEFYNTTLEFISSRIDDPLEQIKYREHLSSYLLSEVPRIEPKKFVETYFPSQNRIQTSLLNQYESKNVELNGFEKDTEHVKKQVEKMKVLFENGIILTAASVNFASEVIIESTINDITKLTIKSRISKMPLKVTKKRTQKISEADS
ncbi:MAG: 37-kD nucleoid-associated bacterial protein [Methanoregula sp. PtaU1.Bin051]|nr:MAG: 37-kD nucleoid-associated bacterial protein [Methanoregula sp. PtaU1.Bin051]